MRISTKRLEYGSLAYKLTVDIALPLSRRFASATRYHVRSALARELHDCQRTYSKWQQYTDMSGSSLLIENRRMRGGMREILAITQVRAS